MTAFTHRYQPPEDRDDSGDSERDPVTRESAIPGDDVGEPVVLVVDVANVMGSRPDGWWRDRAAAASRILTGLAGLSGERVVVPELGTVVCDRVVAVVEGRARGVPGVGRVEVVRAEGAGDDAVVTVVLRTVRAGRIPLVVTADRGLRARLPEGAVTVGPRWLRDLVDAAWPGGD
jgi:hypothetical protein